MVKAKSVKDNTWITGYLWYMEGRPYTPYIIDGNDKRHIVIPETICRSIDIKDRNGRLIFEGDIVRPSQRGRKVAVVRYNKEYLHWYFDYDRPENKTLSRKGKLFLLGSMAPRYAVVGNIWDT